MRKSLPPAGFEPAAPGLGNLCNQPQRIDFNGTYNNQKYKICQIGDFRALNVLRKLRNSASPARETGEGFFIGGMHENH